MSHHVLQMQVIISNDAEQEQFATEDVKTEGIPNFSECIKHSVGLIMTILAVFPNTAIIDHMIQEEVQIKHQPIKYPLTRVVVEMATESFVQKLQWRLQLLQTQVRLLDTLEYL